VDAARVLLAGGVTPTVEQAADRAEISRTTAYRYFPNQRSLLIATYPELEMTSLLPVDAPADPMERLDLALESFTSQLVSHEPELRSMLRLALESPADRKALPLRQGRAIAWFEDALSPLRAHLSDRQLRRLVLAIRATVGIESFVWLTDIGGLSRGEAVDLMCSSARALLRDALEPA
jgi:AcrR family transcriptional regulator